MNPARLLGLLLAVLLLGLGALWTAQAFGWVSGASASWRSFLGILGPLVAGLGLALLIVIVQRFRAPRPDDPLSRRYGR